MEGSSGLAPPSDVQLRVAAALGEVVVVGARAIGLDVVPGRRGRSSVDLQSAVHLTVPTLIDNNQQMPRKCEFGPPNGRSDLRNTVAYVPYVVRLRKGPPGVMSGRFLWRISRVASIAARAASPGLVTCSWSCRWSTSVQAAVKGSLSWPGASPKLCHEPVAQLATTWSVASVAPTQFVFSFVNLCAHSRRN